MITTLLGVTLAAATLLPAVAIPADDLTARLDDVIFRLADAEGARTWALADELRDAARTDDIVAVPHLVDSAARAPESVRLVIADTLLDLEATDEASSILLPMLDGPLAHEALTVLADSALRRSETVSRALEESLARPLPPDRRVAVARTLYKVSRSPATRTMARSRLLEALESENSETQAEAALALAEIQDFESARPVLRSLATDPGPRGQLARTYLDLDDKITYYQNKLYRQSEQAPLGAPRGMESPVAGGPGSLDVLEELIAIVQEQHVLGDELDGIEGRERLITAAAKGMLEALDPHSTYFSSDEFERWILDLRRNYAGIGAYVDTINNVFTVTRPIYSGPAYGAGLISGDQILQVDGWDTYGHPNDEIIRRLKGEPNTEVTVSVYRDGWQKTRDFVITRQVISIPSVRYDMLPGDLGYIEVLGFAEGTWSETRDAVRRLEQLGMEGLIVDLRNNSGGYLDEAVRMCSIFMPPEQLVVYTAGRTVERQEFRTRPLRGMDRPFEGPMVMMVNSRSASASEILAGCLQHYGRAQLVGSKTFGKGSVQQAMPLDTRPGDQLLTDPNGNRAYDPGERYDDVDGDGTYSYPVNVKITNARYYLPDGTSLHTERDLEGRIVTYGGIEPDVDVAFEGLQGWENQELAVLFDGFDGEDPFQEYVRETWDDNRELYYELAIGDDHDTSRYPGFDEFRAGLETPLPDDTIRLVVRARVRDRVADDRGQTFPGGFIYGDWQEDTQLQMGIAVLADEMSLDLTAYEAYDDFAGVYPLPVPEVEGEGEPQDS